MNIELQKYIVRCYKNDTIDFLNEVLGNDKPDAKFSSITCNNRLTVLIKYIDEYRKKYRTTSEYLKNIYYSKKYIRKFEKLLKIESKCSNETMRVDDNLEEYIFKCYENDTIDFLNKVLNDDKIDPQFSSVTCNNRFIALIKCVDKYRKKYKTVSDYLNDIGYSKKDIEELNGMIEIESKYYHGEILTM